MLKLLFFILFVIHSTIGQNNKSIWQQIVNGDTIISHKTRLDNFKVLKKLKENRNETNDSVYAKILHVIGRSYWKSGNFTDGIAFTERAIKINSQKLLTSNKKHLALSYFNLASIQNDIQSYKKAIINFNTCIQLLSELNIRKDLFARSFLMKSTIYYVFGDYENSFQNAEKSFTLSNDFFDIKTDAITLKSQALIELNRIKSAEIILSDVIKLTEKLMPNSSKLANQYFLLANLYSKKNDFPLANKYYKKSIYLYNQNDDDLSIANVLQTIGDNLLRQKKFNLAFLYFKKSVAISKDYPIYRLRALDNIGVIYRLQKKYDLSLEAYQNSFGKYFTNKVFNYSLNPDPRIISGQVDNEVFISLIQHKAETWLAYYKDKGNKEYLQNALETFSVADRMVDYMRQEHVGYQSKLYWRDKTHQLYENAIEVCYLLKNYEKAFYFFEKSRAVLLNDKINNLSANQLLSEIDQIKERDFQQKTAEMNAQLDIETIETKKSQINVKLLDLQEKQQTFVKNLELKYPSYYAFKYDTNRYDLSQMKQYLLKRKMSFIEYFKGDSANYQLIITPSKNQIIKQKTVENLYYHLQNSPNIGPRIIVSQDGDFIPLDTLKNNNGQYLLNNYAFSYTYSAQILLKNAEKKPNSFRSSFLNNFIGFAPVNYSQLLELPNLPGADIALNKVSKKYFLPNNFTNDKATKLNFTKNAADYKIVQLFTHADADNVNKEPTIFFADSAMKVSELESFGKFKTELLILSACKTNVGKVAIGEGVLSMAREFAGLGIPATITTLWSVENATTYQLTELFYKYLNEKYPKDIALQKAKIDFINTNSKEKQNPKYWSAFVLIGESSPLNIFETKLYIYTVLALSVVFFMWLLKKNYQKK